MEELDCVVIGAGVVGLAIARELSQAGREVVLIEREARIGSVTSARNSEVIHAGIHYPAGSAKARLCVAGHHLLYTYCLSRGVPFRRCGKLIVATNPAQEEQLRHLCRSAEVNGVDDLTFVSMAEVRRMEPDLQCQAALHSPSTGIIDSHAYMLALLADAQASGTLLVLRSAVIGGEIRPAGMQLDVVSADAQRTRVRAKTVINAAGLDAPALARRMTGLERQYVPQAWFAKGNYFSLTGRSPFSRLVYPVPEPGGLGIHFTLDMGGQAKFGPDVEWLSIDGAEHIDYRVDPERAKRFHDAIRTYWPSLPEGALVPAYAGVRPKISPPGTEGDFLIQGPEHHGVPGLINLFGIESPGLTSSLALAREVRSLL